MNATLLLLTLIGYLAYSSEGNTPAGNPMFGVVVKDAVFLTTTSTFHGPSGVLMRSDMDWITPLAGNRTLLGLRGDPSDCDFLRSQLEQVCNEHALNFNGRPLPCAAVSNYCRHIIAKHLRNKPLSVEVLIAGWDDQAKTPELYWLDEVGAMQRVPFAAHGRELPFIYSLLDRAESISGSLGSEISRKLEDMDASEGVQIIRSCWTNINKRTSGFGLTDDVIIKIYGITSCAGGFAMF